MTNNRMAYWSAAGLVAIGLTATTWADNASNGTFDRFASSLSLTATDTEDMPGRSGVTSGGQYNLFTNPAPRDFHRPLAPEPHPYTTEPGRVQVEIDPLSYAYDRHNPDRENIRVRAWEVPVTIKLGVLHNVDFQVGVDAFVWEREDDVDAGTRSRERGFGDITLRSKINLWGNDEDMDHAFAVMPFLQLPTARHDLGSRAVQGGVMLPFAWVFAEGWEVEWTPHFAAIRDGDDESYELEAGSLLVLNRVIVENLEAFVEFEAIGDTESGSPWAGTVATGLTYELTPDTILEGGVGFGVTRAADDFTTFITIVQRF
ncbi:transporter [Phycisphaerales bacterium AB-hyl4]|uniref:Transporter n=1 Tax=Natronomicrosphaera hydrolytica TaxID=3242702 RepID=A0ABV4UAT2_9BACT